MEYNKYVDQTKNKVITKSVLNKMALRSFYCQAAFNMERMQAAGWLYSLLPGLKLIHTNKEDLKKSMKMHLEFFNTHPLLITFIQGLVIAMEENKEDIDSIRSVRVSTMGPLGGIGDSLFWITFLTIASSLGASLAKEGSVLGPVIFIVIFNLMQFIVKFGLMYYGYNTGVNSIAVLQKNSAKFTRAVTILGLTVVGGMIATFINLNLNIQIAGVDLQTQLNGVMPRLLPVCYTFLMLYLIKKKVSPTKLVFVTLIIGILGKVVGVM